MSYHHGRTLNRNVLLILIAWCVCIIFGYLYFLREGKHGARLSFAIDRNAAYNQSISVSDTIEHKLDDNQSSPGTTKPKVEQVINACIIILVHNWDYGSLVGTITDLERNFNHKYHYPYIILNDEPYEDYFVGNITQLVHSFNGNLTFGRIPVEQWSTPEWIDAQKLAHAMNTTNLKVGHGTQMSYHHMCRFFAGFFFRHELVLKYDYYLRLDPHVHFPCPFVENPFQTLIDLDKVYGFTMLSYEDTNTIPNLWQHIKAWMNATNVGYAHFDNIDKHLQTHQCAELNCCLDRIIIYNNFEVAPFSLWRDPKYLAYFDHLDKAGGFYYERWGDAPVRSYYLFVVHGVSKLHRFEQIGYGHFYQFNWPKDNSLLKRCNRSVGMDYTDAFVVHCTYAWQTFFENITLPEFSKQVWLRP